jgi:hypothetical protein
VFVTGLVIAAALLASFRFPEYVFPPPPGYSVALLGALAIVMTFVLPKEPSKGEKAGWIFIAFLLMAWEMWAISHDRKEQDAHFSQIVQGLTATIQNNQAVLTQAGQILQETQQVENLTHENLENITGGESFAIITPHVFSGLVPIPLSVRNFGRQTLTGVTIAIRGERAWDFEHDPYSMYEAEASAINIGSLHPREIKVLPETITPDLGVGLGELKHYQVDVSAQNFTVTEDLFFKKGKHIPWDFKYIVTKQYIKSQTKKETKFGYTILAKTDWTDN